MGGSISMLYWQKEYYHFEKTQNIKKELIKFKKRRDTPIPYSFQQSPTRNYQRKFRQLLKAKYNHSMPSPIWE